MLNTIFRLLLPALILAGCATSPTGRSQLIMMPDAQVNQMGLQAFNSLKQQKPISHNPRYNRVSKCVAHLITQETGGQWEVVVFEDQTLNAFALPGNKIGVHTGLIKLLNDPAELAAVIGHEVGHVLARHGNERASEQMAVNQGINLLQQTGAGQNRTAMSLLGLGAQYGILLPYSRVQESEADIIGLDLMAKAGFNPEASIALWQKMSAANQGQQPLEFMSTHPSDATRMQNLQQHMPEALNFYRQAQVAGKQPNCVHD